MHTIDTTTKKRRLSWRAAAAGLATVGALVPFGGAASTAMAEPVLDQAPDASGARAASISDELAPATPPAAATPDRRPRTWAPHARRFILPTHARTRGSQLATWYGPGLWGNGLGCGGTLRRSTWGIAHRTLPCGTLVGLSFRGRRVAVRVIDRGPFSGATVDLTKRTSDFLYFTGRGTGNVRMSIISRYRY